MLRDLTSSAALPLLGAAILFPAFQPNPAEKGRPGFPDRMLVSTAWLQEHLNDNDLVVIQIGRDRAQFEAGHIPGSRFLRLDDLVEQHVNSLNELPPVPELRETFESLGVAENSRVVLADDNGGVLAARAYFTLDYLGHGEQAALLDGGLTMWVAESRKLSNDQAPSARGQFSVHVNPDILVTTAQMGRLSVNAQKHVSNYVLLDARPPAEHLGLVNSEFVSQAGHIAGSQSLYWKKLIRSDSIPLLLDREKLARQFQSAGASSDKTVITYCRTGMQSSFTYFVARYLGYRAAMYDGSVYEWIRTAGNALVRSPRMDGAVTAHSYKSESTGEAK